MSRSPPETATGGTCREKQAALPALRRLVRKAQVVVPQETIGDTRYLVHTLGYRGAIRWHFFIRENGKKELMKLVII